MKKTVILLVCFLVAIFVEERTSCAQAYQKEKSVVSLGYGFGTFVGSLANAIENNDAYKYSSFGPIYGKYEYGIAENIGIGLNLAYVRHTFEYNYNDYDINGNPAVYQQKDEFTSFSGLLRINWHFGDNNKVDPYYGIGMGYRTGHWSHTSTDPYGTYSADFSTFFPLGFETTFGVRVLLSDNFGAYLEAGLAKSVIQVGLCGKY